MLVGLYFRLVGQVGICKSIAAPSGQQVLGFLFKARWNPSVFVICLNISIFALCNN